MAMKHFTLLFACILCTLQLMADQDYPLVEQGKTWRYEYSDGGTSGGLYIDGMLRIDEAVTINGKEYYVVRQYSRLGNTEFDEDGIVAYLREDTEAKRVWCIVDPSAHLIRYPERVTILMYPEEEFLLYDFVKPDGVAFYQDGEPHMFTAKDGSQRNSFPLYGYMKYMITEGIGFLGDAYSCDDEAVSMPGDLFGAVPLISSVPVGDAAYYLPTLYEVTEPDGTVLYCNERVKSRATVEAANATKGCEIAVEGTMVTVSTGAGSLGEITVTAAGGITVRRFDVAEPEFTFNIDGYMPGVYVVRCGDAIRKIAVR